MNIENKAKRRPTPGDHFETKDAYADSKTGWATTEWEAAGLARQRRTGAPSRVTSDGKAISASDQAAVDTMAERIVDKVKVERRAREIAAVDRRVREIVSDTHTLDAASKLERIGAISPAGARDIRRQVVMRRKR